MILGAVLAGLPYSAGAAAGESGALTFDQGNLVSKTIEKAANGIRIKLSYPGSAKVTRGKTIFTSPLFLLERVPNQGCSPTNSGAAGKIFGDSFVEMSLNF